MKRRHLIALALVITVAGVRFASHLRTVADQEISYGPDPVQKIHVYAPGAPVAGRPALMLVHGGAWQDGDPQTLHFLSEWLNEHGITALSVGYRLTPDGARWPDPAADVEEAYRTIRANAARLHLDPDHIGVFGDSAGGHLAAWLARGAMGNGPSCLITYGAPFDLTRRGDFVEWLLPAVDRLVPPADAGDASPALHEQPGASPAYIIHNGSDKVITPVQAEIGAKALRAVGTPVTLRRVDGLDHGDWPQGDARDSLFFDMMTFIKQQC